jgi:hypothetical protein
MRFAWLAVLAACSPESRSQQFFVVDAPAQHAVDSGPMVCFEPSVMGDVMAGTPDIQSCAIWNSLAEMTGNVTLTRSGSMLTMAFMGGIAFTGTVTGSNVSLTYYALHDFEDGCKWRATETLTGTLDPTTCVMNLGYAYVETVEVSNGACATPCTGTSNFSLQINPVIE